MDLGNSVSGLFPDDSKGLGGKEIASSTFTMLDDCMDKIGVPQCAVPAVSMDNSCLQGEWTSKPDYDMQECKTWSFCLVLGYCRKTSERMHRPTDVLDSTVKSDKPIKALVQLGLDFADVQVA